MGVISSDNRRLDAALACLEGEVQRRKLTYEKLVRKGNAAGVLIDGTPTAVAAVYNFSSYNGIWKSEYIEEIIREHNCYLYLVFAGESAYDGLDTSRDYENRYKPDYRRLGYCSTLLQKLKAEVPCGYKETFTI